MSSSPPPHPPLAEALPAARLDWLVPARRAGLLEQSGQLAQAPLGFRRREDT